MNVCPSTVLTQSRSSDANSLPASTTKTTAASSATFSNRNRQRKSFRGLNCRGGTPWPPLATFAQPSKMEQPQQGVATASHPYSIRLPHSGDRAVCCRPPSAPVVYRFNPITYFSHLILNASMSGSANTFCKLLNPVGSSFCRAINS